MKGAIGGGNPVLEAIAGVEILGRPEVNDTEKQQMLPKTMDTLTSCRSA